MTQRRPLSPEQIHRRTLAKLARNFDAKGGKAALFEYWDAGHVRKEVRGPERFPRLMAFFRARGVR